MKHDAKANVGSTFLRALKLESYCFDTRPYRDLTSLNLARQCHHATLYAVVDHPLPLCVAVCVGSTLDRYVPAEQSAPYSVPARLSAQTGATDFLAWRCKSAGQIPRQRAHHAHVTYRRPIGAILPATSSTGSKSRAPVDTRNLLSGIIWPSSIRYKTWVCTLL
ncbi:hypothetical protein PLICRDRAFT_196254 [Plicaturopsis crispa FD-325 SS-3]|nr:hypothetical protein PLICRDRAFT_196254 [Plicaturopsis crispa FD-325 SS-3]